jgi:hypothetical protein
MILQFVICSENSFLPLDHILGTLIHEITHISISSHSAEFYELMEKLTAEVERDMASGFDSQGHLRFAAFSGVCRKLGCSSGEKNHKAAVLSAGQLREARLNSLTRRQWLTTLSEGSGRKLGSGPVAADSSSSDAVTSTSGSKWGGGGGSSVVRGGEGQRKRPRPADTPHRPSSSRGGVEEEEEEMVVLWSCAVCTFLNDERHTHCAQCQVSRPIRLKSGPVSAAAVVSKEALPHAFVATAKTEDCWICAVCTLQNHAVKNLCDACGTAATILPFRL